MLRRLFGSRSRRAYEKGIERFNAGRLDEAIVHFDDALDGEHGSGPDATLSRFYRAEAHGRLGAAALEQGELGRALEHFERALEDHPSYPDLHHQRGLALLLLDDGLAAERAAREALGLNPDFHEAGALLIAALAAQGNRERAEEERRAWKERCAAKGHPLASTLEQGLPGAPELLAYRRSQRDRRQRLERAEGMLHEGFWREAQNLLEALVAETPQYPDLRLRLAAAMASLGDDESAAGHLDAALERNPGFSDAHVLSGIVALRQDRLREASRHFETAEELRNVSSPVRYGRALCELRAGEWSSARVRLDALWADEEYATEARFLRAALTVLDGDVHEGAALYSDAIASTSSVPLLLDAAACGLGVEDFALVRRAIDAFGPGAPDAGAALVRALLLEREGATARAIDVLEAATADRPDDPAVLWELARLHADRGDVDVALRRLSNLDALGAQVPGARRLAARLMRQRGDLDGAMGFLRSGDVKEGSDPDAALEELFVLRSMGESEDALRLWRRWASVRPLDLRWRVQDPTRWLMPLAPWPTERRPD